MIDVTEVGGRIHPKSLGRLAKTLGATDQGDELIRKLTFTFNAGNSRLMRRRSKEFGGYEYERLADKA
ncbi:hypothetical protein [Vibrio sp. Hal054]|uniref:hypothetical protein n=1 Tax=Vibrio sp. Hal054 TaxID=3035158 RepID=UPI00301D9A67